MKQIVMFEKSHRGGTLTALYEPKSEYPFTFMFSKGDKYIASLPCDKLEGCWAWVDKTRTLDNIN